MIKKYTYQNNNELWLAENKAKANGWNKTSDCYWCQIFHKDGNEIILNREENINSDIENAFC